MENDRNDNVIVWNGFPLLFNLFVHPLKSIHYEPKRHKDNRRLFAVA